MIISTGITKFCMAIIQYGSRYYVCCDATCNKCYYRDESRWWVYKLQYNTILLNSVGQEVIHIPTLKCGIEIWREQKCLEALGYGQ